MKKSTGVAAATLVAGCLFSGTIPADNATPAGDETADRTVLPIPLRSKGGVTGVTVKESTPPRIEPVRAPKDAPNVVIVLLDDVGFGATGTFGGPIPTPTTDALAKEGLRYNRFHTTALCSPSRAALLTGRNHHAVGTGNITEYATSFDGYNSIIPRSAATVAQVLQQNGYSTACFGKWHNTPVWEVSPAGPFDRWPTGTGFDEFYGFMGGEAHQGASRGSGLVFDFRRLKRVRTLSDSRRAPGVVVRKKRHRKVLGRSGLDRQEFRSADTRLGEGPDWPRS